MLLLFYITAVLLVASALSVVVLRNAIYSALALVLNLLLVAVLFAAQQAHFLAAMQIIVYAGAIMVLMLFVLMLLNMRPEPLVRSEFLFMLAAIGAGVPFLVMLLPYLGSFLDQAPLAGAGQVTAASTADIGSALFSRYLVPFELTSLLIVAAMAGAVVLGKRQMSKR